MAITNLKVNTNRMDSDVQKLNGGLNQIGYTLSYSGTLIVGLILVNAGQITLPEMMAMWPLSLGIAFGLLQIGFLFTDYQSTAAAVGRLQHIFELPQEKAERRENHVDAAEEEPAVRLEHVSFSYEALGEEEGKIFSEDCRGQGKYALQDCTLSIRKGERVALCGRERKREKHSDEASSWLLPPTGGKGRGGRYQCLRVSF